MDEAARWLQKNTKEASSAVFDFTLANVYFQQEQLEQAAVCYEQAVKKYPKFRRAWKNLGLIRVPEAWDVTGGRSSPRSRSGCR